MMVFLGFGMGAFQEGKTKFLAGWQVGNVTPSLCAVPLHNKVRIMSFHSSSLPFPGPVFRGGAQAWGSDARMQVSRVLASGSQCGKIGWAGPRP